MRRMPRTAVAASEASEGFVPLILPGGAEWMAQLQQAFLLLQQAWLLHQAWLLQAWLFPLLTACCFG